MGSIDCVKDLVLGLLVSCLANASYFKLTYSNPKGEIYLACDILHECDMAIKLKSTTHERQTLQHKFHVLMTLGGGAGIPSVHWFGPEGSYNTMVVDHLGSSLQDLFVCSNLKFSKRTVSALMVQLVIQIVDIPHPTCWFHLHRSVAYSTFILATSYIVIWNQVIFL